MGAVYATLKEVTARVSLTSSEQEVCESLLTNASSMLRVKARERGYDIDEMIADETTGEDYALAVKEVIINVVIRAIRTLSSSSYEYGATQSSQSALGYSVSMTYYNPGQTLYFLNNELKALGLLRQRYGTIDMYGVDTDDN